MHGSGKDDAVRVAEEWNAHPPGAFEDCGRVIFAVTQVIDAIAVIAPLKWAEKVSGSGFVPDDPADETKYSLWFLTRASVSTSRLAPPTESPNSVNEMDFELSISIAESRVHSTLHKTIVAAAGRDLWASPFEAELRELLRSTARQCSDFRGVMQTAQDFYGGFPFHVPYIEKTIACLQGLSSPDAIDLWDYKALIIHRSCLLRETIRLARWIALKRPELQAGANNTQAQLQQLWQQQQQTCQLTIGGKAVRDTDLTPEARLPSEWCVILGHYRTPPEPMPKSTFNDAIHGRGKRPLDAVSVPGQKYRLRIDQLPDGTKAEPLRNKIISKFNESKSTEGKQTT